MLEGVAVVAQVIGAAWRVAWCVQQMLNTHHDPLRLRWFKLYTWLASQRLYRLPAGGLEW